MGTPDFAVPALKTLFEDKSLKIAGVFSQPDSQAGRGKKVKPTPVKMAASELDIPVWQPESLKNPEILSVLKELQPDLIVVVAYAQKIPNEVLNLPPFGCVNIHPSLLPKYRGAAPIQWTLINGETSTGVCTMLMDEGWDTGDVLLCEKTDIDPLETYGELSERLSHIGGKLVVQTIRGLREKSIVPTPQDHSQAQYIKKIKNEMARINWDQPAEKVSNHIRGLSPDPGAFSFYKDRRVKILRSQLAVPAAPLGEAGTILTADKHQGLVVSCGEGALSILEIQPAGKSVLQGHEFVNGYHPTPGEKFKSDIENPSPKIGEGQGGVEVS